MFSKDMIRAMCSDENMQPYAWVITRDFGYEAHGDSTSAVGQYGPSRAEFGYVATEIDITRAHEHGRTFRTFCDDEDEPCYEGKIWTQDEPGGEQDFLPLTDFGEPYAGCVTIKYKKTWWHVTDTSVEPARMLARCTHLSDAEHLCGLLDKAEDGRYSIDPVETDEWETL